MMLLNNNFFTNSKVPRSSPNDALDLQRLQLQIKKEIKDEYIVPLRESVIMLNRLIPDCDLTMEEDGVIETIDLVEEMEQPDLGGTGNGTVEAKQQLLDAMEVEHPVDDETTVGCGSAGAEHQPLDDFSGDLLFETIPVTFLC